MANVCIVVPHADDETLGFAGSIQQHVQRKDNVSVIICRSAHDERTQQQLLDAKTALKVLGVHQIIYLDISEVDISHSPLKLFRRIEEELQKLNPSTVYTTFWGDNHQDHKIIFDCVARAVRVHGPLRVKKFAVGEIPSSTDQSPKIATNYFLPNIYIPLTKEELQQKVMALQCYTTEVRVSPHPRSTEGIITLAKIRGIEAGTEYAEALMLVREIK